MIKIGERKMTNCRRSARTPEHYIHFPPMSFRVYGITRKLVCIPGKRIMSQKKMKNSPFDMLEYIWCGISEVEYE